MNDALGELIVKEVRELKAQLAGVPRSDGEREAHAKGLLSYEDLQDRLTIGRRNPRRPSLRTVKEIVRRHAAIVRPVEVGHTLIGFRETAVERLLSHLERESTGT